MKRHSSLGAITVLFTLGGAIGIARCAHHPTAKAASAGSSAVGNVWEYAGTVTVVSEADQKTTWRYALQATAARLDTAPVDHPPILRFRTAARQDTKPEEAGMPESAVWIQTPGRYTGHLPAQHSLTYAWEMVDALNLPKPFTRSLKSGEKRVVELPSFSLQGELFTTRQQVTGIEAVASHTCYRVERAAIRPQPLGLGYLLTTYQESFWVDTADGMLIKYQGQAHLAGPATNMEITTTLQHKSVRPVDAQEFAQWEQQARLLGDVLHLLDVNPFPGKAQATEFTQAQQHLEQFQGSYPGSPYQAACDSLQDALNGKLGNIKRDQRQADLVGKPAPDIALRDLNGKVHSLKEFRGQVVLLNFFASWCGACHEEVPSLETKFWQKWRKQGLVVVGIDSKEEGEPLAKARAFRDSCQLTYPILADTENAAGSAFWVQQLPVNVVLDSNGIVRYIATGFDADALNAAIPPLLKNLNPGQ